MDTPFQSLMKAISVCDGNVHAHMQDRQQEEELTCPNCDCDAGEHRCIICSCEISLKGCVKREGMCVDHFDEVQYSLKH